MEMLAVCKACSFVSVVPMGKVSQKGRLSVSKHLLLLPSLWVFPSCPRACQDPSPCLPSPCFALLSPPHHSCLSVAETHCKGEPKSHNISLVVAAATESHYSWLTVSKRTVEQGCGCSPSLSYTLLAGNCLILQCAGGDTLVTTTHVSLSGPGWEQPPNSETSAARGVV